MNVEKVVGARHRFSPASPGIRPRILDVFSPSVALSPKWLLQPPAPLRDAELARFAQVAERDLDTCVDFLKKAHPAVAVCGSARIAENTTDFHVASDIGRRLAAAHLPPITGAGPSIMEFVPRAYLEARDQLYGACPPPSHERTLGVGIVVPREKGINDSIECSATMQEFLFRKLALYRNAVGAIVMPGGFGTMEELLEMWSQRERGLHLAQVTMMPLSFWKPVLDTLRKVGSEDRLLVSPKAWAALECHKPLGQFIDQVAAQKPQEQEPLATVAERMRCDLRDSVRALDRVPSAVSVIGGRALAKDDPSCKVLREAARLIAGEGLPLRVGNPTDLATAVVEGSRSANPQLPIQGLMLRGEAVPPLPGLQVVAEQSDFILHKDLLSRHADALIAAPGGLGTLANVFTVLTEIQTGKRPRIPVVLVGESFWKPIFATLRQQMLDGERHLIAAEDIDNLVITDDPKVVADTALSRQRLRLTGRH